MTGQVANTPPTKYLPVCVDGKAAHTEAEYVDGDWKYRDHDGGWRFLQVPWVFRLYATPEAAIEAAKQLWTC